jgi:integrase
VELGHDANGRRRRRVVKARTKRAVLARLAEARRDTEAGVVPDGRCTVATYLASWLDNEAARNLKPSTLASYRWLTSHYVVPHIGDVPLAKLTPAHVRKMLHALEDAGLGANSRRLARSVLRRALGLAERDGLVVRNVAALVEGPSVAGTRLDDALTADEASRVIGAARGDRMEALAVLVLTLGLRRGESLALRWQDIDLEGGTLTVSGTLSRVSGVGVVHTTPKTVAGGRTIPLVGQCVPALRAHKSRQATERLAAGSAWNDGGWVFTTELGTVVDPSNALHWWYRLTERAGVGRRRLHASRHTAATLMLDRGVPLEVVSAVLGHTGLAITADVYARPTADAKRRALETVATALATTS